jgi:hypothetical protein
LTQQNKNQISKSYLKLYQLTALFLSCTIWAGEYLGWGIVRSVERLTDWSDLNVNLQQKLVEKSVKIQGAEISINQLISAEPPIAKCMYLSDLLEEKDLKIADPTPISNSHNEICISGRYCVTREQFNRIF